MPTNKRPLKKSRTMTFRRSGPALQVKKSKQNATDRVYIPRLITAAAAPKIVRLSTRLPNDFSTSGGGVISQVVNVNDPSICTEWTQYAALYDQYKVLECWVNMFPTYNVVAESISTTGGYAPVHFVYDADSTTALSSVDDAMQYGNRTTFNCFRPFKYGVKARAQTDNSVNNAGMAVTYRPGYGIVLDVANVAYYQKGIITWYGDNLPPSSKIGELVIDFFVLFFGRR